MYLDRIKFTNEDLEKIESGSVSEIRKGLSSEDLEFRNMQLTDLTISGCKFKKSLLFRNCDFQGNLKLIDCIFDQSITFIDCSLSGDLKLFNASINVSLSLEGLKVGRDFELISSDCEKISLNKFESRQLILKSSDKPCSIKVIEMKNSIINRKLQIASVSNISKLFINDITAVNLEVSLNSFKNSDIEIKNCRINDFSVRASEFKGANLVCSRITAINWMLNENNFEGVSFYTKDITINGFFSLINNSSYDEASINISGISSDTYNLDPVLLTFIRFKSKDSAIFSQKMSSDARIETLRLLKTKYSNEHLYDEEDNVFFRYKSLERQEFYKSLNWFYKPYFFISYLLGRNVFGWGVSIKQPVVWSILSIIIFAVFYYYNYSFSISCSNLCISECVSIEYLTQSLYGFPAAFTLSLLSFFGQQADVTLNNTSPTGIYHVIQFILGLIFSTLIVGMLIRKLVR